MDDTDYQKLVYIVILTVNVAFMVGAVYTLWKLTDATERSNADISSAANSTQESLRAFRDWVEAFKIAAKETQQQPAPAKESAANQRMVAELQRLAASIEGLDANRLNQMLNDLGSVINGLPEVQAPDSSEAASRARLEAHRERLKTEVEQLQLRLSESAKAIADLRRENRSAFTSGSALDTLKGVNERLFSEMRTMRTRLLDAEEKAALQESENQRLRNDKSAPNGEPSPGGGQHAEIAALQKQLQNLEADRSGLLGQLQETEESMSRMVREKAMIEERYLELDRVQT